MRFARFSAFAFISRAPAFGSCGDCLHHHREDGGKWQISRDFGIFPIHFSLPLSTFLRVRFICQIWCEFYRFLTVSLSSADIELRNIIDKLAEFVARNGPEFELMTKTKQKGNTKFAFLYGGEYYNYYQYKVASKQQSCKFLGHARNWAAHSTVVEIVKNAIVSIFSVKI